jgi:hypothetical protein
MSELLWSRLIYPRAIQRHLRQAAREHIEVAPVINEILDTAIEEVEAEL